MDVHNVSCIFVYVLIWIVHAVLTCSSHGQTDCYSEAKGTPPHTIFQVVFLAAL